MSAGARVRRIVMHPKKQSWLVSAVQWNNEVSMWDVESRQRQEALWASHHPPLTEREVILSQASKIPSLSYAL